MAEGLGVWDLRLSLGLGCKVGSQRISYGFKYVTVASKMEVYWVFQVSEGCHKDPGTKYSCTLPSTS